MPQKRVSSGFMYNDLFPAIDLLFDRFWFFFPVQIINGEGDFNEKYSCNTITLTSGEKKIVKLLIFILKEGKEN